MKFVIAAILLYSCSNPYQDISITDSELLPYIKLFEIDSGVSVRSSVTFADPQFFEGSQAALTIINLKTPYHSPVYINTLFWKTLTLSQKVLLIHHELGHSVLGLTHQDGYHELCPLNLMNYAIPDAECATALLNVYRAQLRGLVQLRHTSSDIYVQLSAK